MMFLPIPAGTTITWEDWSKETRTVVVDTSGEYFWVLAGATLVQAWYHAKFTEPTNEQVTLTETHGFQNVSQVMMI